MRPVFHLLLLLYSLQSGYSYRNHQDSTFLGATLDKPPLKVHMIAHSHDDMGWLVTVDEYYYGCPSRQESVKKILDNSISFLLSNPSKRFIYVEVGFFKMWWNEQDDTMKAKVHNLVKNGQLEFISGGYVMNDEADVYYEDAIEQMTLGHKFLLDTFDLKPEVAWQIDPFGHASAQAALYAQMGFKALFVGRIDYQDKEKRLKDQTMEMVWIPETSQGTENAILTHVNFYHYLDPKGFCFDVMCSDFKVESESDAELRGEELAEYFRDMKKSYKSTDLIHTAGTDFSYMEPQQNFENYDKIFDYINSHPELNIQIEFSTPSTYLNAIYPSKLTYPTKTDDFFPYADHPNAYWTGYFTSRVAIKGLVRQAGRFLQATRRFATELLWQDGSSFVKKNFKKIDGAFESLEEALAIAQHHDAVSGTEKQAVADDYEKRITKGEDSVNQNFLNPVITELAEKNLKVSETSFHACQVNMSAVFCDITYKTLPNKAPVLVAIYNSGPERISTVRLKVPNGNVQVTDSQGKSLSTDVICSNSHEVSDCDLFFSDDFKGYGLAYYYLVTGSESNEIRAQNLTPGMVYKINPSQTISPLDSLSNFKVQYCKDESMHDCYNTQFNLKYNYYESVDQSTGQASGAYIFRSQGDSKPYAQPVNARIYMGKNLVQIHIDNKNILSNLRIYNDLAKGIELESFVGSIPIEDGIGKEIAMIVETPSIQNKETFYTDSMGMELQKRVLNYRPTWDLEVSEPVAGNYYPVLSTIMIKDENSGESLAILPDRSQGGSSLKNGQIELMLHRRLLYDDARGVEEPLNEIDPYGNGLTQWVTHVLLFNKPGYIDTSFRRIQTDIDMPNLVLFSTFKKAQEEKTMRTDLSSFAKLGDKIKWMARPLSETKYLFRFQNMSPQDSLDINKNVFISPRLGRGNVAEMSLSANQLKIDMVKNKFDWNGLGLNRGDLARNDYIIGDGFSLRPLEIRTFIVDFEEKNEKIEQ